jgi:hypothetical protein
MRPMENPGDRKPLSGFVIQMVTTGQRRNPITAEELLAWLEKATPCDECGAKLPREHSPEEVRVCMAKMQEKKDRT